MKKSKEMLNDFANLRRDAIRGIKSLMKSHGDTTIRFYGEDEDPLEVWGDYEWSVWTIVEANHGFHDAIITSVRIDDRLLAITARDTEGDDYDDFEGFSESTCCSTMLDLYAAVENYYAAEDAKRPKKRNILDFSEYLQSIISLEESELAEVLESKGGMYAWEYSEGPLALAEDESVAEVLIVKSAEIVEDDIVISGKWRDETGRMSESARCARLLASECFPAGELTKITRAIPE